MYQPKISDPRVIRKLTQAYNRALANLSATKPRAWGTRQIDRWFGYQHTAIGQWLRTTLLVEANSYYNSFRGIAKTYTLNVEGATLIAGLIGKKNSSFIPCANDLKRQQLSAAIAVYGDAIESGAFEYREKSNRLWNDLQNIPNETRKPLFANYGYIHEYDIKSSAPTILTQYAKNLGSRKRIPTVEAYLENPNFYRQRIADSLGIELSVAKRIITSRFAGARFGNNNAILSELGGRWILHNRLKEDTWFQDLSRDIKKIWDTIKIHEGFSRLNSRQKWSIYFREEMRVMRGVHRFLEKNSIQYFHEHDGWRSNQAVDIYQLKNAILRSSGYRIEFDYEIFERDIEVPLQEPTHDISSKYHSLFSSCNTHQQDCNDTDYTQQNETTLDRSACYNIVNTVSLP